MNDVELIQSFCLRYVNKLVREHFKDIENLKISDDLDLTNARQISRKVCYHQDKDPLILTACRLFIFYLVMGGLKINTDEIIYGMPVTEFHETVEFEPQVIIWFRETTKNAQKRDAYPTKARISFRLKNENISEAEARALAKKIKSIFATPIYKIKKGRIKASYIDKAKGYRFILTVNEESEARNIIQKTLQIQNHSPEWERLSISKSERNWNEKKTKKILGKQVVLPERRPIATVQFHHVELKINGLPRDVILVDASGNYPDAYEYV